MIDKSSEPVSLKSFNIVGENGRYSTFTNRNGRFVVEGMQPGNYMIHQNTDPSVRASFILEEVDDPLVYLEPIILSDPEVIQFDAIEESIVEKKVSEVEQISSIGSRVRVQSGDSIWRYTYDEITRAKEVNGFVFSTLEKHRLTLSLSDHVVSTNELEDGNIIYPGQEIIIPNMESFIIDYNEAMRLSF